jgi:ADP-L-glycero-D-manno-heptose 6-epimerase
MANGQRMLLVTGGAGFIGSNVVASLNEAGRTDVAVCDTLGSDGKWQNLQKRQLADVMPPDELFSWLNGRKLDGLIHMGAISETTAVDGDLVLKTNFSLSLKLLDWCTKSRTPFIYASSAATYGDGSGGFIDDWSPAALKRLKPMNLYGWSKHLFDQIVVDRASHDTALPPQWAGLKFFNVFGPNEYHKGEMMSLIAKRFDEAKAGKPVRLFKSYRSGIADGDQRRDFVYVDDAVAVVRWLLDSPQVSGIFNVGTGKARSFHDLICAMYSALGREPHIEFIEMPEAIRDSYQYFTQASVEKLHRAGYNFGFTPLEEAVKRYVTEYLDQPDRYR